MKCIMQPLYNFLNMCNLCIPITINLYLQMSRCCLEVVSISKHLVWHHIFKKCQNLGGSDEMYYAATVQFSKNVQFVHSNYHKFIFTKEQMMFGGCSNFKTSSLVLYFWKMSKNLGGSDEMYYAATTQFSEKIAICVLQLP